MPVSVQTADFDAGKEIAALYADAQDVGAVASFVGVVRQSSTSPQPSPAREEGASSLNLEHYPGMTEAALAAIVTEANARWHLHKVRVIHRVGNLQIGEQIVFVGVAAAHRGEAFTACEFIMDYLKTQAPFWKKEETAAGGRWVDARDADDAAAARWS
ncbi:MAG: molybdopterin synthase catalytic subunit MoaE [Rhodocyclaceae bacterium]|nr:molybdopterin synthase catalytic subunit MoaE [Rhodocyclaceae bacterium]MBP6108339.1 molybdopterin synthase catalytic subunit MoaE [Rhodocyclaceae bacterium]MBP6278355.1 molybdopterin synthase catalytic subunit MoaE [Rhodocyclaceae bacterium]